MPAAEIASAVIEELAEELLQSFLAARDALTTELGGLMGNPEQFRREARIRELVGQIDNAVDHLDEEARRWAERRLPHAYRYGSQQMADDLGVPWQGFTQADIDAITTLANDTMDDVLARTSHVRFEAKRMVRQASRSIAAGLVQGQTATQIGTGLAAAFRAGGVTSVIYANGMTMPLDAYAQMLARTKTAVAINAGGLAQATQYGVQWLECFDGPACGWASHHDLEAAHGKIVTVAEAADVPIAHPNCARSFGPRPDLKGTDGKRTAPSQPAKNNAEAQFRSNDVGVRRGAQRAADGYGPGLPTTPQSTRVENFGGQYEQAGDTFLRTLNTDGRLTDHDTYLLVPEEDELDALRWLYDPDTPETPAGFEGFMLEVLDDPPDADTLARLAEFGEVNVVRLPAGARVVDFDGSTYTAGRFAIDEPGEFLPTVTPGPPAATRARVVGEAEADLPVHRRVEDRYKITGHDVPDDAELDAIAARLDELVAQYPVGVEVEVRFISAGDPPGIGYANTFGPPDAPTIGINVDEWRAQASTRLREWGPLSIDPSHTGTIAHEYGHVVDRELLARIVDQHPELRDSYNALSAISNGRFEEPAGLTFVSAYASENSFENSAETFAALFRSDWAPANALQRQRVDEWRDLLEQVGIARPDLGDLGALPGARYFAVDARHEGVWWPNDATVVGDTGDVVRLPARLDPPDVPDALDRDAVARLNPWSAEDLAQQRLIELERERAARAARDATRRRQRPRRQTQARRARPEPDFTDVIPEPDLAVNIPPWARGTPFEDAARLFDADGGYLPYVMDGPPTPARLGTKRKGTRRNGFTYESHHYEDHYAWDPDRFAEWIGPDGNLTARGLAHEQALRDAGQVIDDEVNRRARRRLEASGTPPLEEAKTAHETATAALHNFRAEEGPEIIGRALGMSPTEVRWLKQISDPDLPLYRRPQRYRDDLDEIYDRFYSLDRSVRERVEFEDRQEALMGGVRDAGDVLHRAETAVPAAYRDSLVEVMGEIRPMGGRELNWEKRATRGKPLEAQRAVDLSTSYYPADWLDYSNNRGTISSGYIARGHHEFDADTGHSRVMLSANNERGIGDVHPDISVATHELGHRMEQVVPRLRAAEWAFHTRRTTLPDGTRTPMRHMGRGYGRSEQFRDDQWDSNYMGKTYGGTDNSSWEVFTMGMEALFVGSHGGLIGDADYRRFMVGALGLL